MQHLVETEAQMRVFAAEFAKQRKTGDVVLLEGPLGVGKTTFARAVLKALGWPGEVRSPTFNLLQIYETDPPVAHADLYRLKSAEGVGLEMYLDSHLCLIEWPDRFKLLPAEECWQVNIQFASGEEDRVVTITPPSVLG